MTTGFKKIICPTDFSPFSEMVLKKGVELAKLFNAELLLMHVITNPWSDMYSKTKAFENNEKKFLQSSPAEIEAVVVDKLQELLKGFAGDVTATIRVAMLEHTYQGIIDAAEEQDADLIVMSTHGRTGAKRFLTGSVTENVVRKAPCSVLVVRE